MKDNGWLDDLEGLVVSGRTDSAFGTLREVDAGVVCASEKAVSLFTRMLLSIGLRRSARILLSSACLDAGSDYAFRLLLRREESLPLQPPPEVDSDSNEEVIAARAVALMAESADHFDFETWISESSLPTDLNPRPLYAFIALEYAGASQHLLNEFATRLALIGYREERFLGHAATIVRNRGKPREAERLARLGLLTWPNHGKLWLSKALSLSDLRERTAAAEAAARALNEFSFSAGAKHQISILTRSRRFKELLPVINGHIHSFRRFVPVITRMIRTLDERREQQQVRNHAD